MKGLRIALLTFLVFAAGVLSACSSDPASASADSAAKVSHPSSHHKDTSDIVITDSSTPDSSDTDKQPHKKQTSAAEESKKESSRKDSSADESPEEASQEEPSADESSEEASQEESSADESSEEASQEESSADESSEEASQEESSADESSEEESSAEESDDKPSLTVKDVAGTYHMVIDEKAYNAFMEQGGSKSLSYKKIETFFGREFAMNTINTMSKANIYIFSKDSTRISALDIEKAKVCEKKIYTRMMDEVKNRDIDEAAELLGIDPKNIKRALESDPSQTWQSYCEVLKKQLISAIDKRYSAEKIAEQYPGSRIENGKIIVHSGTFSIKDGKVITNGDNGSFELKYTDGFLEFTGVFKNDGSPDNIKVGMKLKKDN